MTGLPKDAAGKLCWAAASFDAAADDRKRLAGWRRPSARGPGLPVLKW
jgi:hypothetical protein